VGNQFKFSLLLRHAVWWLDTSVSIFNPEDGGSTILRNVGVQPPHYTTQPTEPHCLEKLKSGR